MEAPSVSVHGKVTRHTILGIIPFGQEYDLQVDFEDQAGGAHEVRLQADSFVEAADTKAEPELRYDPADPSRVELSWFAGMRYGPWAWAVWPMAFGGLMAWFLVAAFRAIVAAVGSARACARQSEEIEVRVVSLEPVKGRYGRPTGKWLLKYELPRSPLRRAGVRAVTLDGPPVPVPGRPEAALALLSRARPEHPTFPLQDLAPFEVGAAERAAFQERLDRGQGQGRQPAAG